MFVAQSLLSNEFRAAFSLSGFQPKFRNGISLSKFKLKLKFKYKYQRKKLAKVGQKKMRIYAKYVCDWFASWFEHFQSLKMLPVEKI